MQGFLPQARQEWGKETGARIQVGHGATKGHTLHQGGTSASHALILCWIQDIWQLSCEGTCQLSRLRLVQVKAPHKSRGQNMLISESYHWNSFDLGGDYSQVCTALLGCAWGWRMALLVLSQGSSCVALTTHLNVCISLYSHSQLAWGKINHTLLCNLKAPGISVCGTYYVRVVWRLAVNVLRACPLNYHYFKKYCKSALKKCTQWSFP